MIYRLDAQQCGNLEVSARREWLLPNGIGGYAMGTPSGINTRRYHGLLVAAVTPPAERMVLLAAMDAFIQGSGNPIGISANQYPGAVFPEGFHHLKSFVVGKTAVWRYEISQMSIEKRLYVHPGENACTLEYKNIGTQPLLLTLRPMVCHKPHHENFLERSDYPANLRLLKGVSHVDYGDVSLTIRHGSGQRVPEQGWYYRFEHGREIDRGLDPRDDLYCPFELRYELIPGESAILSAGDFESVAPFPIPDEEPANAIRLQPMLEEAAEKFLVKTKARTSIIAGYPWFTDWGRDTMISLPGILLCTGRMAEARQVLRDYASQCRHGLIPNRFVEVGDEPDYNTVDATLWFVNAIYKTLLAEWDETFAQEMVSLLRTIFEHHRDGTLFGIGVDPEDGLLRQGEPGVQLTWMDAKIGDWVVTPRHGKPVEISGLWINALRCMVWLRERLGFDTSPESNLAELAEENFDRKFWHEGRGHYLDTADPADASLRPNQLIAMALPFAPAKGEHAIRALDAISWKLFTPRGIRTLDPDSSDYRPRFEGPMVELDSAYHQGTAWPWLLGVYATALVKVKQDVPEAKRALRGAKVMLTEYGLGGIAEVYDAEESQRGNGCPWQAWSVGEILRAWVEDVGGD